MSFTKHKKEKFIPANEITDESTLETSLEINVAIFKDLFKDDGTVRYREFQNQVEDSIKCCIIFVDGMINNEILNENLIWPVMANTLLKKSANTLDELEHQVIVSNDISRSGKIIELSESMAYGDTIFLVDGFGEALIISSKGWPVRSISEPAAEKITRGPREGFAEAILVNLSLIRRKIKNKDLKFKFKIFGKRTRTNACICYIDGIVNTKILKELEQRLDKINIDGVLDTGYIQEFINDAPLSPFKTIGHTERPDVVAGKLLEGRIALVLDGSPVVLTLPYIFIEHFQSSEDYYTNFFVASMNRLIRIFGAFLTISTPAIYVALTTYHQEMIPTRLLISVAAAREGVPFPTIIEAFALLFVFELLRETGTRLPSYIGQALSIVGALVLGQAAVEAKFVSAPMVIMVALTGITGLIIPEMQAAVFVFRVIFLLAASVLGLYGYAFGVIGLLIHLFSLTTFGIPYTLDMSSLNPKEAKDTAVRVPWFYMKHRPKFLSENDYVRQSYEVKNDEES